MSDVSRRDLEDLDEEYQQAPEPEKKEFDRTPIPDGDYQAEAVGAELVRSKAGDPMVKLSLRIVKPKCAGRRLWYYRTIIRDQLEYLKRDLFAIGLDDCKVSELPDQLPEVVGKVLAVTLKSKGERQNIYLNRVVSDPVPKDDAPSKPTEDDDFPFK